MSETEYKQVQIGPKSIEIPREWVMKMAGELFEIRKDRVDPSELDEVVDLYSMPAFDEGKGPKKEQTSEIGSKKYLVPDDTLLFPKLNIRKQRFWRVKRESETKGICSTEYWPLIPQEDLDLDFYNFYFRTHEFRSHPKVSSSSSTNSHKRVNQSSFEKIKLPVPPLPEQRRIAEILSTVDEAIQQTDEIIETSKELKKGLMQDLLTKGIGHNEFKEVQLGPKKVEIPEEWAKYKLEDVSNIITRGKQPNYVEKSDIKVVNQSCIYWDGFHRENVKYLDEETAKGWKDKYFLHDNDVLINSTGKGTLGRVMHWEKDTDNFVIDSHVTRVDLKKDFADAGYLRYYLESSQGQEAIFTFCVSGSTGQIELSKGDLTTIPLIMPPLDEQREIAERLSVVDEKIRQEEEYREKLEELKRGLMQDLLTGKNRVKVSNRGDK